MYYQRYSFSVVFNIFISTCISIFITTLFPDSFIFCQLLQGQSSIIVLLPLIYIFYIFRPHNVCVSSAGRFKASEPIRPSGPAHRAARPSPVDQGVPHGGSDGGGLRRLAEPEDALDDRQLRAGGVQAAEGAPIVGHHAGRDHLAAAVHRAGLDRREPTLYPVLVPLSSRTPARRGLTTRGTCSRDDSSSWSSMDVFGWTRPPWLLKAQ